MDNSGYIILLVLVVTLMFLAFLFLIRELICWYYKINERLEVQYEILEKLKEISTKNEKISKNFNKIEK